MITSAAVGRLLPSLDERKSRVLISIFSIIESLWPPNAVFLKGSYARGSQHRCSDIDVIVVFDTIEQARRAAKDLPILVHKAVPVLIDGYTDRFPWFGRLWTFYFEEDQEEFSVDIGIITLDELDIFYVEPEAIVLLDVKGAIAERKDQCYGERPAARTSRCADIEFEVFHSLVKLRHALERGHLWNALEYVNILRRILFELIRMNTDVLDYIHVGRAERNIEDAVPWMAHENWEKMIPEYRLESIIDTSRTIVNEIITKMREMGVLRRGELLNSAALRVFATFHE